MSKKKGGETPAENKEAENEFTYDDFDDGTVFRFITDIPDPYDQGMAERRLAKLARAVGFSDFKRLLKLYKEKLKPKPVPQKNGISEFSDQPYELDTGEWHADDSGIWKYGTGPGNIIVACSHLIMPIERMRSIDTGILKYRIWFQRGMGNRKIEDRFLIDASDMASPTEIVKIMAPKGISVSGGDRAKALVDYLRDMADLNYELIDEVKSVSRMGWNDGGFSPYVTGVEFDSAAAFSGIYNAIKDPSGTMDAWLEEALDARKYSTAARIVLAASFSAPLVEKLGCLSYFVHLWSTAAGTGKTVGLMLGASVWGNPLVGGPFFPTFRSTSVGFEMMAGFLHSIPLFIDELQLAKDHHGKVTFNVYELASGSGKLRSNRSLGLNYTPQWLTCFITSGETPIVKETDGEGALSRVIEIECYADNMVIKNGHRTANVLKENYGHAGRLFIAKLMEDGQEEYAKQLYEKYFCECTSNDTTDKQAMAAAVILTADHLATEWIFHDERALTVKDIVEFLKTKERISLMQRGYDAICDWVYINANKFNGYQEGDGKDVYGEIEDGVAYMFRSAFNKACFENSLDPNSMLSHLRAKRLIETSTKGYTKNKRFGKFGSIPCICLRLSTENSGSYGLDEPDKIPELPF